VRYLATELAAVQGRLATIAGTLLAFVEDDSGQCAWIEIRRRTRTGPALSLLQAIYLTGLELSLIAAVAVMFSALSTPVLSALYTLAPGGSVGYDLRAGRELPGKGRLPAANLSPICRFQHAHAAEGHPPVAPRAGLRYAAFLPASLLAAPLSGFGPAAALIARRRSWPGWPPWVGRGSVARRGGSPHPQPLEELSYYPRRFSAATLGIPRPRPIRVARARYYGSTARTTGSCGGTPRSSRRSPGSCRPLFGASPWPRRAGTPPGGALMRKAGGQRASGDWLSWALFAPAAIAARPSSSRPPARPTAAPVGPPRPCPAELGTSGRPTNLVQHRAQLPEPYLGNRPRRWRSARRSSVISRAGGRRPPCSSGSR
jgi:hypothetical protein